MKILLDTHIFLWAITDDPRLSASYHAAFTDGRNELFLSVASIWEATIKASIGKLILPMPAASYLSKQMEKNRVNLLGIQLSHLAELQRLPPLHRDPFDRMLAAQARAEGLPMMSVDPKLQTYGVRIV